MLMDVDYFLRDLSRGMQRISVGEIPDGSGTPIGFGGTLTDYWYKLGISGTFTAYMGLGPGQGGTLSSTADPSKGKILLGASSTYDEANVRLGIGTTAPTDILHLRQPITATTFQADSDILGAFPWDTYPINGGSRFVSVATNDGATNFIGAELLGGTTRNLQMGVSAGVPNATSFTISYSARIEQTTPPSASAFVQFSITRVDGRVGLSPAIFILGAWTTSWVSYSTTVTFTGAETVTGNTNRIGVDSIPGAPGSDAYAEITYISVVAGSGTAVNLARWDVGDTQSGIIDEEGKIGVGTGSDSLSAMLTVEAAAASTVPLALLGATSQTGDYLQALSSGGVSYAAINSIGNGAFGKAPVTDVAGIHVRLPGSAAAGNRVLLLSGTAGLGGIQNILGVSQLQTGSGSDNPPAAVIHPGLSGMKLLVGRAAYTDATTGELMSLEVLGSTFDSGTARISSNNLTLSGHNAKTHASAFGTKQGATLALDFVTVNITGALTISGSLGGVDVARTWTTLQKFPDNTIQIVGSADNAKIIAFEADGLTAGTHTYIAPPTAAASSDTLVTLGLAQTFTQPQTIDISVVGGIPLTLTETANGQGDGFFVQNLSAGASAYLRPMTYRRRNAANDTYMDWYLEMPTGDTPALELWRANRAGVTTFFKSVDFPYNSSMRLFDLTDQTKIATFLMSGLTSGTHTYNFPPTVAASTDTLAAIGLAQSFSATQTFTVAPKIDIASAATGFVWTATDNDGNGVWSAAAGGTVFADNVFQITGSATPTKIAMFDVDTNVPVGTNTYIFPALGGTLPTLENAHTVTGAWVLGDATTNPIIGVVDGSAGSYTGLGFLFNDVTTGFNAQITFGTTPGAGLTANRIISIPDANATLVSTTATQTMTNKTLSTSTTINNTAVIKVGSSAGAGTRLQDTTTATKQLNIFLNNAVGNNVLDIRSTAARTYTTPDASIIFAGSAAALTSGKIPVAGTGGILADMVASSAYTPTNVTTDRAYDANATSLDELSDVVGTIIADLQAKGILG